MVEVTERIAAAAERLHPEIAGRFDWEVVFADDDDIVTVGAPGGKMAVYTGILPYTKTPTASRPSGTRGRTRSLDTAART